MENTLSWETPEYEYTDKDPEWFWVLGVIVASISIAAILLDNVFFGILIIIAGVTLALAARKGPSLIKVAITEKGIVAEDEFRPYENLRSFSIDRELLLIERHALWHPILILPIADNISPEQVRLALMKKLPEKNFKEPLSHRMMNYLGF